MTWRELTLLFIKIFILWFYDKKGRKERRKNQTFFTRNQNNIISYLCLIVWANSFHISEYILFFCLKLCMKFILNRKKEHSKCCCLSFRTVVSAWTVFSLFQYISSFKSFFLFIMLTSISVLFPKYNMIIIKINIILKPVHHFTIKKME
jgi:hypothetical protein